MRPVGVAGVHLCTCAAVYGERLYAAVLQLFGKVGYDEVAAVPSQTGLDGDGCVHCLHHLARYVEHEWNVLQHARTGSLARHFLDGAAEVEVDDVGMCLFHYLGRLHHGVGVAAVYLYAYGPFVVAYVEFVDR